MGLGSRGGAEVVRFLVEKGADVTVTDLKKAKDLPLDELSDLEVKFTLGGHRAEDFRDADLIIRNPAVPAHNRYLEVARRGRVPVWMESTLFFSFCPSSKIIGITGTKGKTTTATLIAKILNRAGKKMVLAGNMGISMLAELPKITPETFVVLELSSFQLEGLAPLKKSPWISIITNIYPDHLNHYRNFEDYISAKKEIVRYQSPNDILLIDKENPHHRDLTSGIHSKVRGIEGGSSEIAREVGKIIGLHPAGVERAIRDFRGLPHRLEKIATIKGISFYNDSCATNPHATVYSIGCLGSPIVLITGGTDKNLDYEVLAQKLNREKIPTILLEGSATRKLLPLLDRELILGRFSDLFSAVRAAFRKAVSGSAVLFSPASASFEMFKDEFDRGEKYKEVVKSVTQ